MAHQIPYNFLALEPKYSAYDKAKYAILPIPYDATTSFQVGTRNGPAAVIRASSQVELFDEELEKELHKAGIATLDAMASDSRGPEQTMNAIATVARKVIKDGKFLFGLGGEHSVSGPLIQATAKAHKNLSILQIDAHLDLRAQYEGSPYSHAAVMRRAVDMGIKTIVPVGIRNVCTEEHTFLKTSNIRPIMARECHMDDGWLDEVLNTLTDNVYVTIDIDGFDPAYAPGTGTPEPGGLDWYQVTGLLRLVAEEKTIVGADVVEVLPIPGQAVTEFLAARLMYKLICYIEGKSKR